MKQIIAALAATFALALTVVSPEIAQSIAAHVTDQTNQTAELREFTIDEALEACQTLAFEYRADCIDAAHATIWE